MKNRWNLASFSLKIMIFEENCQQQILRFTEMLRSEITFTLNSRKFWSWYITSQRYGIFQLLFRQYWHWRSNPKIDSTWKKFSECRLVFFCTKYFCYTNYWKSWKLKAMNQDMHLWKRVCELLPWTTLDTSFSWMNFE